MEFRSQPLTKLGHYSASRNLLFAGFLIALSLMGMALLWNALFRHSHYRDRAEANLQQRKRLDYPRGNILDSNGVVLATNRKTYSVRYSPYGRKDSEARATLEQIGAIAGNPGPESIEKILATRPRWTRHLILDRVELAAVLPFLESPQLFPGIRVAEDYSRQYSHPIDFAHVIGYLSRIQQGEEDTFSRPRYLLDDLVGRAGIERQYQEQLAGHPGRERLHFDARGRALAEPELLEPSIPGADLDLALDSRLQSRAMRLLSGQTGSIILLDVHSGELPVLASRPVFDPQDPGAETVEGAPAGFVNLAIRGLYPPGSTFKIAGAAAALAEGIPASETIHCSGRHQVGGWLRPFHCAVRTGHGPTDLVDSLKESCNVYYYEVGERIGWDPVVRAARAFGFGEPTGVDLPGERAGQLSATEDPAIGERTNLIIGQGSMLASPLQVARAFAGLATGRLPVPHVVTRIDGKAVDHGQGRAVPIPAAHRELIIEGLSRVVAAPGGTARKAELDPRWEVCGKTGTAENGRGGIDAWFAGFFPRSAPRYAFVVHIVDADGHGGEIAGPIARELIAEVYAAQQAEAAVAQRVE